MQKYDGFNNNCQHFVTTLYAELGCGYDTAAGWAVMSSDILPNQIPIQAEILTHASARAASSVMVGLMALLTAIQI